MKSDVDISALIDERGLALSRDDLSEIEYLLTQGDFASAFERRGFVMEAVSLIISDPAYKGDIEIEDIEVE